MLLDNVTMIITISDDIKMGGLMSYFRGLFGNREMRILILGLDGAGKTTLLYRLQVGEVVTTIPTIGFNVEQVRPKLNLYLKYIVTVPRLLLTVRP